MLGLTKRKTDSRRRKGLAGIIMCLMPILVLGVLPLQASPDIKVRVFGREISFDAEPVMDNGRIMVPVRKIGDAFAQRGHVQRKHTQPIVQVFAEAAIAHHGGQIPVGGSDDADIHLGFSQVIAHPLETAAFQNAEEEPLGFQG